MNRNAVIHCRKINGDIDSDDLISLIDTAPFFTSKNVLLIQNASIFRETKKGSTESEGKKATGKDKKMERLLAAFADMPSYSYIIFVSSDKADKRRKVYKTVEKYGAVLEAEAIRAWNINDWLQGKLQSMNRDMDRDAYAYFNGAVSMMQQISLEFLDREFDKLALFSQDRRITKETLTKVFAGLPEVSIFALMDAISERNGRRALDAAAASAGGWHVFHGDPVPADPSCASAMAGPDSAGKGHPGQGTGKTTGTQSIHCGETGTGGGQVP
jgi:DNA polymerase-3 subunit delta